MKLIEEVLAKHWRKEFKQFNCRKNTKKLPLPLLKKRYHVELVMKHRTLMAQTEEVEPHQLMIKTKNYLWQTMIPLTTRFNNILQIKRVRLDKYKRLGHISLKLEALFKDRRVILRLLGNRITIGKLDSCP